MTTPRKSEVPIGVLKEYFRVPVGEVPVHYVGRPMLLGSVITNISTTGVFIRTPKPLDKGVELEISFTLPNTKKEIRTKAVVRWTSGPEAPKGTKPDPHNPQGMGVQFVKMASRHKKLVDKYVEDFLSRMRGA